MTEHTSSGRRTPLPVWAVAAASLLAGMLLMWVILKVDFGELTSTTGDAESTDELARAAFAALKAEDFRLFAPYVVHRKDMQAMYDRVVAQGDSKRIKRGDDDIAREGGLDAMVAKSTEKIRAGFVRAVAAANNAKVDWRRAEYGGLNDKNSRLRDRDGVRSGRVSFFVRDGNDLHTVRLRGAGNPAGVWVCGSGFEFVRAEEVRAAPNPVQLPKEAGIPRVRTEPAELTEPAAVDDDVVPEQPQAPPNK